MFLAADRVKGTLMKRKVHSLGYGSPFPEVKCGLSFEEYGQVDDDGNSMANTRGSITACGSSALLRALILLSETRPLQFSRGFMLKTRGILIYCRYWYWPIWLWRFYLMRIIIITEIIFKVDCLIYIYHKISFACLWWGIPTKLTNLSQLMS